MLSIVLTAAVVFPEITSAAILTIFGVGTALAVAAGAFLAARHRRRPGDPGPAAAAVDPKVRANWRMPPLALLTRPQLSTGRRLGLTVLRGYLIIAVGMVVVRVVQLALTP